MTAKARGKKLLRGYAAKDSLNQTVKVAVNLIKIHPIYKKRYVITRQYLAQTDKPIKKGETVFLQEGRRVSKRKSWKVVGGGK